MPENIKIKNAIGITGLVLSVIEAIALMGLVIIVAMLFLSPVGLFGVKNGLETQIFGVVILLAGIISCAIPIVGYITFLLKKKIPALICLCLTLPRVLFLPETMTGDIALNSFFDSTVPALLVLALIILWILLTTTCAILGIIYATKHF